MDDRPFANSTAPSLRIGLIADAHYADKEMAINRYYRQSLDKAAAAVEAFNGADADLAVELGDLIDSGENDAANAGRINAVFQKLHCPMHHVLGNHCVERLSKREFLDVCGQQESFYSFDCKGIHLIILDGCFRRDGVSYDQDHYSWTDSDIPPFQREWLAADLQRSQHKSIIFVHQRLDAADGDPHGIHSREVIRQILQASGKVAAVVQGHYHRGDCTRIDCIPYLTLPAMAEGTGPASHGHSLLTIARDGTLRLDGFGTHAPLAESWRRAMGSTHH